MNRNLFVKSFNSNYEYIHGKLRIGDFYKKEHKTMQGIIEYSHHLLKQTLEPGEIAVDATCGNGHDTLVLSHLVDKKGKVLAFDIQDQAIENTKKRLKKENKQNVTVIKDSHANIDQYLKADEI